MSPAVLRAAIVVAYLLLTASIARANPITIDFERFPGPDATLGTADDTFPTCAGSSFAICDALGNQFVAMGITFTSGLLARSGLFPGSSSSNTFISSSPPDATFSVPVFGISITSYSFWTATLYALDDANNIIASYTLANPNAGSAFFLGTLSVTSSQPIRRFTVLAAGCTVGGPSCDQILNLDNLVLTLGPLAIPTMTEWGMLALLAMLGATGALRLRQRSI